MIRRPRSAVLAAVLVVSFGCCHVQDLSNTEPYRKYIGTRWHLADDGELWNRGTLSPA